jgi:hypothetical protein
MGNLPMSKVGILFVMVGMVGIVSVMVGQHYGRGVSQGRSTGRLSKKLQDCARIGQRSPGHGPICPCKRYQAG